MKFDRVPLPLCKTKDAGHVTFVVTRIAQVPVMSHWVNDSAAPSVVVVPWSAALQARREGATRQARETAFRMWEAYDMGDLRRTGGIALRHPLSRPLPKINI
jgi:hypothetical protein